MRFAVLFGALLVVGCSTAPTQQYDVAFPTLTVAPGVEKTQCVVLNLHNSTEIHVGQIHNLLSEASHHMIVYRVNDTVEQPTPFEFSRCSDGSHAPGECKPQTQRVLLF